MSNPDDQPLTAEAAALLAAETAAHAETAPSPASEQAATAAAMSDRGPELPAEADMDAFMAQMRAQFADMQSQLEALKTQQAEAFRGQGEPYAVRYATGAADKVKALIAAHPDAPQGHFAGLLKSAEQLAAAAAAAIKGSGGQGELEAAAAAVIKFATRGHGKGWNKHVDWSAILDDVETAVEEGQKILAA